MFKLIILLFSLVVLKADGLTFVVANDSPYHTDNQLTSACEIRYLPNKDWSFHAGMDMYTPRNKKTASPVLGQHPYNTWVYFGAAYQKEIKSIPILSSIKFDLGGRGPHVQGGKVQEEIHSFTGGAKVNGWDSETPNEFGYLGTSVLEYAILEPFPSLERYLQISLFSDIKLGSIIENYSAGMSMTLGYNVPNYHTLHVMPGIEAFYLFGSIQSINVKKNRFLDGNDIYNVEKVHHIKRYDIGVNMDFKKFRMRMIAVTQGRTFITQKNIHRYAILEFGFAF